jgi:hypothetical protein
LKCNDMHTNALRSIDKENNKNNMRENHTKGECASSCVTQTSTAFVCVDEIELKMKSFLFLSCRCFFFGFCHPMCLIYISFSFSLMFCMWRRSEREKFILLMKEGKFSKIFSTSHFFQKEQNSQITSNKKFLSSGDKF